MCSIIGYIGNIHAAPLLVKSLKRMEYRGYDSVGIATFYDNKILIKKGVGKVADVNSVERLDQLTGNIGIGHTRWATHGGVNNKNAHPHVSSRKRIAIVHNGIIDNYSELKTRLQNLGYSFQSQTDSEVIANLLQYNYDCIGIIKETVIKTLSELKGSYSFVALFEE